MKKYLLGLVAFLSFTLVSFIPQSTSEVPSVTIKGLSGENVDFSSVVKKGRVTVVSFWATWCSPCIQELDEMLTMIFSVEEVSKFICRKLYRYFVYYYIDSNVENNIITPLANIFIANNFEIKPVLKTLLQSEHFYDSLYIGCQIKSPVDHVVGFLRQYEIAFPDTVSSTVDAYALYNNMLNQLINMGQDPVNPPNVAGWPAYYQSPDYNEIWINADTLPKRNKFTDLMLETGYTKNGKKTIVNAISFVQTVCTNPADPNILINTLFSFLVSTEISSTLKATLKTQILLSGQASDYYWTNAWNTYLTIPNTINFNIVNKR